MTDNHGGIEEFIYTFATKMNSKDIYFDFINMSKEKIVYSESLEKIGKVLNIENEFHHPIKCYKSLKKILKKNKYDAIHINKNSVSSLIVLFAAKKTKVPLRILHSHNTKSNGGFFVNLLHRVNKVFAVKLCNKFLACSDEAASWMFTKNIINEKNYTIINNAIDLEKFTFNSKIRKIKRKELGFKKKDYVIGHVGRFVEQKNHKYLLEIFEKYYLKNNNAKLVLIGVGPLMDDIKRKAKERKLEKNIIFLSNRKDVNELYQVFDIFVFPSTYEGLGIVLIEAQCSGLPCLASSMIPRKSQVTNLIKYISPSKDVDEWVENLGIINDDRSNREYIKQAEKYGYNIKIEVEKLKMIYLNS